MNKFDLRLPFKLKKEHALRFSWGVFFLAFFVKYAYYGYHYFPVMDDWIQYGTYSISQHPFQEILLKTQIYAVRPMAALTDVYLITKFWGNLGFIFFLITCMHAASAYLFSKVLQLNGIKIGWVFLIIYALLPFGSEATYWISASARLVIAMFLLSVALFFASKYIYVTKRYRDLGLFFFFQLLSTGYYEPVTILGFLGAFLMVLKTRKTREGIQVGIITLVNHAIITSYYFYFSMIGKMTKRGEILSKDQTPDYKKSFDNILEMLSNSDAYFYMRGFRRGLDVILQDGAILFSILLMITFVLVFFGCRFMKRETKLFENFKKIGIGFLLFWAPFIVFFIIKFNWVSLRNAFTSFIGLGLMVEGFVDIFFYNKFLRRIRDGVIALLVVFLIVVSVSELSDYRRISLADSKIGYEVIEATKDTGFVEGEKSALLINIKESYSELNKQYHEHISSVAHSTWALTGMLRGIAKTVDIKSILPVIGNNGVKVHPNELANYVLLGLEDNMEISKLIVKPISDSLFDLIREDGEVYGKAEYKWGHLYFLKR